MYQTNTFNTYFKQILNKEFYKRFEEQKELGRGTGSIVIKAKDKHNRNKDVAIKYYNRQQISQYCRVDIVRQISNLRSIQNVIDGEYFVRFYDSFMITQEHSWKTQYCIVLQYCECTLGDLLQKKQTLLQLPESDRIKICIKIAKGVGFLHLKNIIHRDLKPDNILLNRNNKTYQPFISDFGHSKNREVEMTRLRGTPLFVDPYLQQTQNYGFQWDIYSIALIFLLIMSGEFLINLQKNNLPSKQQFHRRIKPALQNIKKTLSNFKIRAQVKTLIQFCLTPKINLRWDIQKVIKELERIYEKIMYQQKQKQEQELARIYDKIMYQQKQKQKQQISTFESILSNKNTEIQKIEKVVQHITKSSEPMNQQSEKIIKKTQSNVQQQKNNPESSFKLKKTFSIQGPQQLDQKHLQILCNSEFYSLSSQDSHQNMVQSGIPKSTKDKKQNQITQQPINPALFRSQQKKIVNKQPLLKSTPAYILRKPSKTQKNDQLGLKLINARINQQVYLNRCNDQITKSQILKNYQKTLQNIRSLQALNIKDITKKKIMILAFIHLKIRLKQNIKLVDNDKIMVNHLSNLLKRIESLFNPLLQAMILKKFAFTKTARDLLQNQTKIDCSYVKKQISEIINNQCLYLKRSILDAIQ